jgi:hypothetical protein
MVFTKEDNLRVEIAVLVPTGEDPIRYTIRMTGRNVRKFEWDDSKEN